MVDPEVLASSDRGRVRHLPADVEWEQERADERIRRRDHLCRCDGLLSQVEEHNAAHPGEPLPPRILARYRQLGGALPLAVVRLGPHMIEAIFAIQDRWLIRPAHTAPIPSRYRGLADILRLHRD